MTPDGSGMALDVQAVSLNGSAPRCEHLSGLVPVIPQSSICGECRAAGEDWAGLLVCLTCGWVACTDGSPRRYALAHYEETDHPVSGALRPGPPGDGVTYTAARSERPPRAISSQLQGAKEIGLRHHPARHDARVAAAGRRVPRGDVTQTAFRRRLLRDQCPSLLRPSAPTPAQGRRAPAPRTEVLTACLRSAP
jgi:hypothetical protein